MEIPITSLLKFVLFFIAILLIIFILTLLTPKIAAIVDKLAAKIIKKDSFEPSDGTDAVKSIYDLPGKTNDNKNTGDEENGEE